MARVAVKGGGAYDNRRHLRRPLESGPAFRALTELIVKNLPRGVLYVPTPQNIAHVSLLDSYTLSAAIANTRRRQKLHPHQLIPRLREAVPESGNRPLTAPVARIQRLGDCGTKLAVILNCPEADEEREGIHLHLERLGHLTLRRRESCHVSLGNFSERVPDSIMKVAENNTPSAFDLGSVLPRLEELAAGAGRVDNAA